MTSKPRTRAGTTRAASRPSPLCSGSNPRNTSFGQCSRSLGVVSVGGMHQVLTRSSTPDLTGRQREVVELIAAGLSNEEVGERLGISPRTAKAHSDVLRQKLGVARRRQIPIAFRLLTGEDPLLKSLGSRPGSGD